MKQGLVIELKVIELKVILTSMKLFIYTLGEWVIVNSNRRHIFESNGGSGKNYFTILIGINAGGDVLPPFVIYEGQHLIDSWCRGGPPGTFYGITDKVELSFLRDYFCI